MVPHPLSSEKQARRQAILEAAVRAFAEKGFAKARTRDIAAAAGIAEGTLYLYFDGKDDLLLTAFRERVNDFSRTARRLVAEPAPFEERLVRFVHAQLSGIESNPSLAMVLLMEARQSALFYGEPVREVLRTYASAVDDLIRSGIEEGRLRSDINVPLVRRMLIGGLDEIALHWLLGQRTRELSGLAQEIAHTVVRGISENGRG